MSEEDLEGIRKAGEQIGRILARLEGLATDDEAIRKRVARLENGILAALAGGTYFFLKSAGILP